MAGSREVKGFALNYKFLHESVFPKYPYLRKTMSHESFEKYKTEIYKPINEERRIKIQQINKKSVYREF